MEKIPITIWGADVFDGTPENPKLRRFMENALREIMKESLGVFRRSSCVLVMTQGLWDKLLLSAENDFILHGIAYGIPVNHPNTLYGFEIKWIDFSWCEEEISKRMNEFVYKDGK